MGQLRFSRHHTHEENVDDQRLLVRSDKELLLSGPEMDVGTAFRPMWSIQDSIPVRSDY
jgi:hypothetical protein